MNVSFKLFSTIQLQKDEIIIFDETNSSLIKKIIPDAYSYSIYKTRPIEIVVTFKIILNFFINLKDIKIFEKFTPNKGLFKNILWQLLCIYIKSYILVVRPKAVITSIDNCNKFAWLSKNIAEIPFIAIQNGFRLNYAIDKNSLYNCQHLFCFGKFELNNFPKRNWIVSNYYPVGSLNASLYFNNDCVDINNEFDILVVSCWRGNIGFTQDVQDSMKAMRLFDHELAAYLRERDLKVAIIMRSERDSDQWIMPEIGMSEEEYFQSIYGKSVILLDTDFKTRNVYSIMQKSNVILAAFPSTCLFEALGIEKKVLFCNFTNNNEFFSDIKSQILYTHNNESKDLFYKKLDSLLSISQKDYLIDFKDVMNYYAQPSETERTHELICNKINKIIKSKNN